MKNQSLTEDISKQEEKKIKFYTATQYQLMWWRFRKHKLAIFGSIILLLFLIIVVFAEFIAVVETQTRDSSYVLGPPQKIHWFQNETGFKVAPFIYGSTTQRDPETLALKMVEDTEVRIPVRLLVKGEPYKLLGLIPGDVHLIGI